VLFLHALLKLSLVVTAEPDRDDRCLAVPRGFSPNTASNASHWLCERLLNSEENPYLSLWALHA
jgi:hypothetical protein